jgi:hypothetical protein
LLLLIDKRHFSLRKEVLALQLLPLAGLMRAL